MTPWRAFSHETGIQGIAIMSRTLLTAILAAAVALSTLAQARKPASHPCASSVYGSDLRYAAQPRADAAGVSVGRPGSGGA